MIEIFVREFSGNNVNLVIVTLIGILAAIEIIFKKDLKSQIISLGVLGTFIGIFMGLQDFNPADIKNSINSILIGLKTAFFTSIVGMSMALFLGIIQKIIDKDIDDSDKKNRLLSEILDKLGFLERLDNTAQNDKLLGELERLRSIQSDTRNETKKVSQSIQILKDNSNTQNQELISILNTNFQKMNNSLEIAIEKLSKGATEEIINALKEVIESFNQELQSSFGDNFVQLNQAVIKLLQWQENYKSHIEELEAHLTLSSTSIEKSKESLEIISSKNEDIIKVYEILAEIINTTKTQIDILNQELETYGELSSDAKNMFSNIQKTISMTKDEFTSLSETIIHSNSEQKQSFDRNTQEITKSYANLTENIKDENFKQLTLSKEMRENIEADFNILNQNLKNNQEQLKLIIENFKNIGAEIPNALQISLDALNRGLTSLTKQFQEDYAQTINQYKEEFRR